MNAPPIFGQAQAQHDALPREWGFPTRFDQIGFVVDDLQRASAQLGPRLGITSWYRLCLTKFRTWVLDVPLDQTFEIVVGYSGRTQIELMRVSGSDRGVFNVPSFGDPPEIHHLGYIVRDLSSQLQRLRALGLQPSQTGHLRLGHHIKTRLAYWDRRETGGGIVELIEQRVLGLRIGMPERLVRLGALTGHFEPIREGR